jgi:hypothetical protein
MNKKSTCLARQLAAAIDYTGFGDKKFHPHFLKGIKGLVITR